MSRDKAILIAANIKGDFKAGSNIGSILAHASHIETEKAALWSIVPPSRGNEAKSFLHDNIRRGYFYDVTQKKVTHAFDLGFIKAGKDITSKRSNSAFVPYFRKEHWKDRHDSYYWMKITGIYRLKRDHVLKDFQKSSDKKPVRHLRNYAIVVDPNFAFYPAKITRREIMSDYIGDLLIAGKVTEKDIEELFFHRLSDKFEFKDRQGSFKNRSRLDLLFKNSKGNYIVYELKKGAANRETLDQIRGYMKGCLTKYKIMEQNIKGIILAKSIDPELNSALKKVNNIKAKTYFFLIDLK